MFTVLTTWISERIITITAVSVLTVAAVPTTLVIVSHDDHKTTAVAVIQPVDAQTKAILVSAVKKAGDDVIAGLFDGLDQQDPRMLVRGLDDGDRRVIIV